jgi:hypothetical protein
VLLIAPTAIPITPLRVMNTLWPFAVQSPLPRS